MELMASHCKRARVAYQRTLARLAANKPAQYPTSHPSSHLTLLCFIETRPALLAGDASLRNMNFSSEHMHLYY